MNLIDVEYTFDRENRILFYRRRQGGFRELVRDLAAIFRTRIELRQIGFEMRPMLEASVRAAESLLHHLLGDFEPVSIRMAKDQNLS